MSRTVNNILQIPQKIHQEDEYPENWKDISSQIKKTANYRCEICACISSRPNPLTVHHKNGIKHDCRQENLIALCAKCHLKEQAILRKRKEKEEQERLGQKNFF